MLDKAVEFLNPGARILVDYVIVDDGETRIDHWKLPGKPPTIAELQNVVKTPQFKAWHDERGGNPAATLKKRVRDRIASAIDDRDEGTVLVLALIDVIADRFGQNRNAVRNAVVNRVADLIDGNE